MHRLVLTHISLLKSIKEILQPFFHIFTQLLLNYYCCERQSTKKLLVVKFCKLLKTAINKKKKSIGFKTKIKHCN